MIRLAWLDYDLAEGDTLVEVVIATDPTLTAAYAAIKHVTGRWTVVHRALTIAGNRRDVLPASPADARRLRADLREMMTAPGAEVYTFRGTAGREPLEILERRTGKPSGETRGVSRGVTR